MCFLTNKVYYNNTKDEYYPLTDTAIDTDYINRLKEYTDERLEVSDDIIVHDLIKKEEKSLEG